MILVYHKENQVPAHLTKNDYMEHDQFIAPPNSIIQSFNGHIVMSLPHLREQLPEEPQVKTNQTEHGELIFSCLKKSFVYQTAELDINGAKSETGTKSFQIELR